MFDIEYKGGNTVIVSTKKATLIVDPKASVYGAKDIVIRGAVQLATEPRLEVANQDYQLSLEGPGEYEVSEFSIKGVPAIRHIDTEADGFGSTLYRVEVGGARIAVIGNVAPVLTESQLEELGVIDIVVLPVGGGGYTLDATSAAAIVRQMEPKAVIPVHFADNALSYEVPQDTFEVFTKELGAPVEEAGAKYKVKNLSALPAVLTTIAVTRS